MTLTTRLTSLVLGLASLKLAAGAAIAQPEVVPGPGLPSLEQLGLTSAELYSLGKPNITAVLGNEFSANFDPRCGPAEAAYVNVNDIIACFHYLDRLGHQDCVAPPNLGIVRFCTAGNGVVSGQALDSRGSSSWCSDVAKASLYTIDHCTRPDQSVAGFQAANGNGNLIVGSTNKRWIGG
ncbi:hypothetical protein VFPPC_05757 [Pochonia chlamydosporia 170]|uniref:Secreted protein n=1 Tax=Pochonia chlamydosporia 170 TaxID=1380566 RepID=A0A179FGV8_METCM|nr:hypothetical protein VFPPC_05757 [Pochonia chlamydosporia 170]OAQ64491.1 hypothetical protein VFPPC_05757 [Pochonia chlamydosporia 170]